MKKLLVILILSLTTGLFAQDITNTIGSNGKFTVKDDTDTFMTINQSDGNVGIGTAPTSDKMTVDGDIISSNLPSTVSNTTASIIFYTDLANVYSSYSGYYVQIGPILIQWGTIDYSASNVVVEGITVTLPTAYGDNTYSISIQKNEANTDYDSRDDWLGTMNSKSATSFSIRTYNFDAGNDTFTFTAIGIAP